MEINCFLAKSKTNSLNTYLVDHTRMTINFGMRIGKLVYKPKDAKPDFARDFTRKDFFSRLALALCLHDIGKMTNATQKYLGKGKSVDDEGVEEIGNVMRHNTYSWAYVMSRLNRMATERNHMVPSAILYHHTCYVENEYSNDILNSLSKEEVSDMDKFYLAMKNYCSETFKEDIDLSSTDFSIQEDYNSFKIDATPIYQHVNKGQNNIINFQYDAEWSLIRAILIFADRLISSGNCDLEKIYNNDTEYIDKLYQDISTSHFVDNVDMRLFGYDKERLSNQYELLEETKKSDHNAVMACAGYGKTLLGLMWYMTWKKRLLWIVPRNVIATNTYLSIIKELKKLKIYDKVKVGTYYSGSIVEKNTNNRYDSLDDFDILVTNIDSVVGRTTNNSMAHLLVNMYTSNVIFDEFHEFVMPDALYSAFIRLMRTRSQFTDSKTLLLSATAVKFNCFWGPSVNYIGKTPILFGDTKITIRVKKFGKNEKLIIPETEDDTFVICRTVADSQKAYLECKKIAKQLIHSRFTSDDREKITNSIFSSHGNADGKKSTDDRHMVIGTNIIGTGLDISCKIMYDFLISPEATIQRCCGRCSRFGEYNHIIYYVCDIDQKKLSPIITDQYDERLYKAWLNVLYSLDGKTITKRELYEIFEKFKSDHEKDLINFYFEMFKKSSKALQDIKLKSGSLKSSDNKKKLANGMGYRGLSNSVFVTAKNTKDNSWCESINVDYDAIFNADDGEGDNGKLAENFMFHDGYKKESVPDHFHYSDWKKEKYKMPNKKFRIDSCKRIAKDEDSPIPVFDFVYNSELGLINKNLWK